MDKKVYQNMRLKTLARYACQDDEGYRLNYEEEDIRTNFYRDIDRIIYSLAYTRYLDKTQVFTHRENDHLSRRMTHVQFVSKIARTIGRALNLNEDLIEASALGHDLGHTPFGHVGEAILNEISMANNEGYFNHNIQSVRCLMYVENYGKGLNITVQVLDAIMCHNGEFALGKYYPKKKIKEEFLNEYKRSYTDKQLLANLRPMTLEGCVVRISDMIAYLGKDIEDAVRLGLVKYDDIPKNITDTLGFKNREIVNTIMLDIIENSLGKNYIKLSDKVYKAIVDLKKFNYENIYVNAYNEEEKAHIKEMFQKLFNKYLNDLEIGNQNSLIYKSFLHNMDSHYKENTNARIVIDYLAGMTDDYLIKQYNNLND